MSNGYGLDTGRIDLDLIAQMIAPESRVLDVGCGDGDLLALLRSPPDTGKTSLAPSLPDLFPEQRTVLG